VDDLALVGASRYTSPAKAAPQFRHLFESILLSRIHWCWVLAFAGKCDVFSGNRPAVRAAASIAASIALLRDGDRAL
jgi:hypothetical protein